MLLSIFWHSLTDYYYFLSVLNTILLISSMPKNLTKIFSRIGIGAVALCFRMKSFFLERRSGRKPVHVSYHYVAETTSQSPQFVVHKATYVSLECLYTPFCQ